MIQSVGMFVRFCALDDQYQRTVWLAISPLMMTPTQCDDYSKGGIQATDLILNAQKLCRIKGQVLKCFFEA